jgi:hypothetical protein
MAKFKVKRKKGKEIPASYFRERELREIRKRHKGRIPISKIGTLGFRTYERYPRQVHKVNQIVIYKGKRYVVKKVSRKGVHLSTIKRRNGLIEGFKLGKPKFVPEKEYSGRAVPIRAEWFVL